MDLAAGFPLARLERRGPQIVALAAVALRPTPSLEMVVVREVLPLNMSEALGPLTSTSLVMVGLVVGLPPRVGLELSLLKSITLKGKS
jgi:hypothetical protein